MPSYRIYPNRVDGWMTQTECDWLYETAKRFKTIVEVGSWQGRSTIELLYGVQDGGLVTAVDTFEGDITTEQVLGRSFKGTDVIYNTFLANTAGFKNLKVIRQESATASKLFSDKSVEMIFIDADHTYEACKSDLLNWQSKCSKLLCGHDYPNWVGVKQAIDELFGGRFSVVPNASIWYVNID